MRPCTATGPKACASTAHARGIVSTRMSTARPPTARNRLVVHLAYNANGQVSQLTANGMTLAGDITCRPLGAISGWVAGNGDTYQRNLDEDGRIAGIDLQSKGSPYSRTLNYDPASRITGITDTSLPSKTFGYDALNRLTSYDTNTISQSYTYDADGNRLDLTTATGGTDYAYAAASNRLLTASGADTTTYEYDTAGHTTAMDAQSASTGFVFDARGRMVQSNAGGHLTHYSYNGLGQRVEKRGWGVRKVPGKGEIFLYDHAGHLMGEYTAAGRPIEQTVWLGNLPVAVVMQGQKTYFIYPDHLGAPHEIADAKGRVVWTWNHGPFGNTQPTGTITYNLHFPGQYYDNETGLNYNYFRDYDPSIGRYLESDPIGLVAGLNTYAYVGNNPVVRIDPQGRAFVTAAIGTFAGAVAGYEAGGWKGAAIGGAVGGIVGFINPFGSAAAATVAVQGLEGSVTAGILGTGGVVADSAFAGATGTVLTNVAEGKNVTNDLAYGTALGALAPLMSGQALAVGGAGAVAGEAVWGTAGDAIFSGLTGLAGIAGMAVDPNSEHGALKSCP